jgi:asparagine synthase (glutamine-hydrolysing)
MCGICGIIYRDRNRLIRADILQDMSQKIVHRGPDDDGYFVEKNIGIAMRRLSIIDIAGGKQPIYNEDESIVTVYNGEIYNYLELKENLRAKGHTFKTNSDTEVLVHLYEEYGVKLLDHINGMFAFAVYDRKHQQLLLARDRLGIKPLYYIDGEDWFIFASEIKSFMAFPEFNPAVDFEALHHYLTFRFVPAPLTLFKGVKKLPPGHLVDYSIGRKDPEISEYWDFSLENEEDLTLEKASLSVRELINDAVKIRLMSEVPLGVMLSGGVDSSAIVTAMRTAAQKDISTFTIAYEEEGAHNEGVFAKIAAMAFRTDHHEIIVRLDDFIENLERMVYFLDEPVADPAAIPIFDLCRFSKEHVTVLLAGVGGDELYAGYEVYKEAIYWNYLRHIPRLLWENAVIPLFRLMPESVPGRNFVTRMHRPVEDFFLGSSFIYGGFSEAAKADLYVKDFARQQSGLDSQDVVRQALAKWPHVSPLRKMMYVDTKHWLADSHLIMMDKMSMANSIELRTPLLDHRLVEQAALLPDRHKLSLSKSKIVFKDAFRSKIPKEILTRPKRGFSTPINLWLNRSGHELSDILLNQKGLMKDLFKRDAVERLFERHKQGYGDFSASIMTLMVLCLWLNTFMDDR